MDRDSPCPVNVNFNVINGGNDIYLCDLVVRHDGDEWDCGTPGGISNPTLISNGGGATFGCDVVNFSS